MTVEHAPRFYNMYCLHQFLGWKPEQQLREVDNLEGKTKSPDGRQPRTYPDDGQMVIGLTHFPASPGRSLGPTRHIPGERPSKERRSNSCRHKVSSA